MADYIANRRLYRGAGEYIEKGQPVGDVSAADKKRLLDRGVISERKKEPVAENKMKPAPANKTAKG